MTSQSTLITNPRTLTQPRASRPPNLIDKHAKQQHKHLPKKRKTSNAHTALADAGFSQTQH